MIIIDANIDMPTCCEYCFCHDHEWNDCQILSTSRKFAHDEKGFPIGRPTNCPLKEVPENKVEKFWITVQNYGV